MTKTIMTGYGAAKYGHIDYSIPCSTLGCLGTIHSSAYTSLAKFCAFCWRRCAVVQHWIDRHAVEHLLATGEAKERITVHMRATLDFARTASQEDIVIYLSTIKKS